MTIITKPSKSTKILDWAGKILNVNRRGDHILILHDYKELGLWKNI